MTTYHHKIKRLIEKIRHHRIRQQLTQKAVGVHLGISQNAYSKIELGLSDMTVTKLYKIVDLLNVSLLDIMEQ